MEDRPNAVKVRAPARLHLGLIDMNGSLGRRFGSIGLAVDAPAFALTMRRAGELTVVGPEADRVRRYARQSAELLGVPADLAITVDGAMPAHAGFGSGTQVALAVTAALARLNDLTVDPAEVGARLARGARSGSASRPSIRAASSSTGGARRRAGFPR